MKQLPLVRPSPPAGQKDALRSMYMHRHKYIQARENSEVLAYIAIRVQSLFFFSSSFSLHAAPPKASGIRPGLGIR